MYHYLVYGAGRQGLATIYDLLINCEAEVVSVIEPNDAVWKHGWERLTDELLPTLDISRLRRYKAERDFTQFKDVDVILSCAPYAANLEITKTALEYDIPMCDLGGNPEMVQAQKTLASQSQTPIVPECGISPGITNMLASHMAKKGATKIEVRCGGLPTTKTCNELGYILVFSPEGLISEYSGQVPTIQSGELVFEEALSGVEQVGEFEAAFTSNNAPEIVQGLLEQGVQDYTYKTLRYPGHWTAARSWKMLGLFNDPSVLADKLKCCEPLQFDKKTNDYLTMWVKGSRSTNGKLTIDWSYNLQVQRQHFSAMEMATSWGITIVAHWIAEQTTSSTNNKPEGFWGFWTSEKHMDGDRLIVELNKRLDQLK